MKLRLFIIICLLSSAGLMAQGDMKKSLVAYWSLDDGTAIDGSGNGHHGTVYNSPTKIYGIRGKALSFDGNGKWMLIPKSSQLNFGKEKSFSISLWFRIDTFNKTFRSSNRPVISKSSDYSITLDTNNQIVFRTGTTNDSNSWLKYKGYTYAHWYHLVTTMGYDTSSKQYTRKMYLDDSLVLSATGTEKADSSSDDLRIGLANIGGNDVYFYGKLDEIRIYNRELNKDDIKLLFKDRLVGVDENFYASEKINIFPNPATDVLRVHFPVLGQLGQLQITDISGRSIANGYLPAGSSSAEISTSAFAKGVYIISIISGNTIYREKFICR